MLRAVPELSLCPLRDPCSPNRQYLRLRRGRRHHRHPRMISGRRSASPSHSTSGPAPLSKYKVASAADDNDDDPFRITTASSATNRIGMDKDGSGSDSDVEMPGIGEILAEREARSLQRMQRERLKQIKLAALAQQQKGASLNVNGPQNDGHDSDDDELDVVPDTMHSVAREEAAARATAGRTRPSAGRTTQLRLARVPASPQRGAALPLITAPSDSPEKRMAAAAQPAFLPSLSRGSGATSGRGKRNAGMTKAELERMMLRSAEAQSEQKVMTMEMMTLAAMITTMMRTTSHFRGVAQVRGRKEETMKKRK